MYTGLPLGPAYNKPLSKESDGWKPGSNRQFRPPSGDVSGTKRLLGSPNFPPFKTVVLGIPGGISLAFNIMKLGCVLHGTVRTAAASGKTAMSSSILKSFVGSRGDVAV